jgi:outer membrane receptor protein involved in Fe transport
MTTPWQIQKSGGIVMQKVSVNRKWAAALLLGVAWSPALQAQETVDEAAQEQSVDEIVVTAERGAEQKLLETPLSVTAITGETLEQRGTRSIVDVLRQTPGASVFQFQPGQSFIQIRGMSATTGDATTGYYLDDLPFTLINLQYVPDVNPFDVQRVEVLRGPQGTLYGASSEGGTVRILTNNADPTRFEARAGAFYSSTRAGGDSIGGQGVINVPLVKDVLALRVSGDYADLGGYLDNPLAGTTDINDSRDYSVRGKLTFRPAEGLEARAMVWSKRLRYDSGFTSEDDYTRPVAVPGEFYNYDLDLYNLALDYESAVGRFYSTSSLIDYKLTSLDGSFGVPQQSRLGYHAFNQEVRFASAFAGPFQINAGAFYLKARQRLGSNIGAFLLQADTLRSQQWAVFGEASYKLTPELKLTAGLRYFHDNRSYLDSNPGNAATLAAFGVSASREASFHRLTPRLNLSYLNDNGLLIYGNIAQGFRSGSHQLDAFLLYVLSSGGTAPQLIGPEHVWSYEAGFKTPLFGGVASIEAAIYYNDWSNLQVQTTAIGPLGIPYAFVQNVGSAHALGGDLNLVVRPTRGLSLQVGGNINGSSYAEDLPGLGGIRDGDRIANVPKFTLSAAVDYEAAIGGGPLSAVVHAGLQHSSPKFDYFGGNATRSDTLTFMNLRVGVKTERWGLYLTGENLLDERGRLENLTVLIMHGHPRPRTLGLAAEVSF